MFRCFFLMKLFILDTWNKYLEKICRFFIFFHFQCLIYFIFSFDGSCVFHNIIFDAQSRWIIKQHSGQELFLNIPSSYWSLFSQNWKSLTFPLSFWCFQNKQNWRWIKEIEAIKSRFIASFIKGMIYFRCWNKKRFDNLIKIN